MDGISRRGFYGVLASTLAWSAIGKVWGTANRQTSVALLMSGVITDGGWSQLAYDGLKRLKSQFGFKTAYAENISLAQMDQVARGYSDDGFDLILGHGLEFTSTLLEVAPDFLQRSNFRQRFEDKGAYSAYLKSIPTWFITAQQLALRGCATIQRS